MNAPVDVDGGGCDRTPGDRVPETYRCPSFFRYPRFVLVPILPYSSARSNEVIWKRRPPRPKWTEPQARRPSAPDQNYSKIPHRSSSLPTKAVARCGAQHGSLGCLRQHLSEIASNRARSPLDSTLISSRMPTPCRRAQALDLFRTLLFGYTYWQWICRALRIPALLSLLRS
jgi:hypothetical protein